MLWVDWVVIFFCLFWVLLVVDMGLVVGLVILV